jgi:two-component system, NarL family, nitrate/nitrite response regulator NarL
MTFFQPRPGVSSLKKEFSVHIAPPKIGIFVLSSVRLHRDGLVWGLSQLCSLSVLGSASLADNVAAQISTLPVSVLVVDATAPKDLEQIKELMRALPRMKTIVIATLEADDEIIAYAEAGVAGYITGEGSIEDLSAAIVSAENGELICSPKTSAMLFQRLALLSKERLAKPEGPSLTRREREVANLMAAGLSNKEIAIALRVQFGTVKNHVHSILRKLRVRRRSQASQQLGAVRESWVGS